MHFALYRTAKHFVKASGSKSILPVVNLKRMIWQESFLKSGFTEGTMY